MSARTVPLPERSHECVVPRPTKIFKSINAGQVNFDEETCSPPSEWIDLGEGSSAESFSDECRPPQAAYRCGIEVAEKSKGCIFHTQAEKKLLSLNSKRAHLTTRSAGESGRSFTAADSSCQMLTACQRLSMLSSLHRNLHSAARNQSLRGWVYLKVLTKSTLDTTLLVGSRPLAQSITRRCIPCRHGVISSDATGVPRS